MSEEPYLDEVRRALFVRGVWGREARRITEQLADHHRESVAALCEEGMPPATAVRKAIQTMGDPETIARAAAEQLRARRGLARHPWLGGLGVAVTLWLAFAAITAAGFGVSGLFAYLRDPAGSPVNVPLLQASAGLANWTPFLAGALLLAWIAMRSPGSWKSLFVLSLAVGISTSALTLNITPPTHGPGTGLIVIAGQTWLAVLLQIAAVWSETVRAATGGSIWRWVDGFSWVRLCLPVLSVAALRYAAGRTGRPKMAA